MELTEKDDLILRYLNTIANMLIVSTRFRMFELGGKVKEANSELQAFYKYEQVFRLLNKELNTLLNPPTTIDDILGDS